MEIKGKKKVGRGGSALRLLDGKALSCIIHLGFVFFFHFLNCCLYFYCRYYSF